MKNPKYCINEKVELIKDCRCDVLIKKGTQFIIRSFPVCVRGIGTQFNYFLYGKTEDGKHVRAFIEDVKRIN